MDYYDWLYTSPTPFRSYWWEWRKLAADTSNQAQTSDHIGLPSTPGLDEHIQRIVRKELADLLPIDVPDTPPEA